MEKKDTMTSKKNEVTNESTFENETNTFTNNSFRSIQNYIGIVDKTIAFTYVTVLTLSNHISSNVVSNKK